MSIRRHASYNLFGALVPLALSLVTIPIYVGIIGEARYGVLAIAWLLLGYFGLFDLGLGRATAQRIAARPSATGDERAETFWTALGLNLALGILGGLLIWPVGAYFFDHALEISQTLRPEVRGAVPWLILAVPIATVSGVLSGALRGRERFLDLNLTSIFGTAFFQLLPLATAMFWSPDLRVVLPSAVLARVLTLLVLFELCRRRIFGGHRHSFNRPQASQLLRFGGWVTVTSFVGPLMVMLDRFVIGALSGAKAVSYYTIPFQLGERSMMLPSALASALFPRLAAATREEERSLAKESLHAIAVVMTPAVSLAVFALDPFLAWWISPEFSDRAAPAGRVLLAGFWACGFAQIPYAQLQAQGRPDLVAKAHIAELLPYLGLLYVGLRTMDLVGAAAAFSLRVVVDLALLAGLADILSFLLEALLLPLLLVCTAWFIAAHVPVAEPAWFGLVGLHTALNLSWSWRKAPASIRKLMNLDPLLKLFQKPESRHK